MKTRTRTLRVWASTIVAIISIVSVLLAFTLTVFPARNLTVYLSAIALGFSLTGIFVSLFVPRVGIKNAGMTYISFPHDIREEKAITVKKALKGSSFLFSDAIVGPGEDYREALGSVMDLVKVCYVFVSGDLSPRQRFEVKEFKKRKVKIIPVVDEADSIPSIIRDYEPLSFASFLSLFNANDTKVLFHEDSNGIKQEVPITDFELLTSVFEAMEAKGIQSFPDIDTTTLVSEIVKKMVEKAAKSKKKEDGGKSDFLLVDKLGLLSHK